MQKLKNLIHPHGNTTANPPIVHQHQTTNTIVPPGSTTTTTSLQDRNMNGIPDSMERRHNPLDRNNDGKVGLSDLKPGATREAALNDRNRNGVPDNLEYQRTTSSLQGGSVNRDRNYNGIPDDQEYQRTITSLQGGLMNQDKNFNGIPDSLEYQNVRTEPAHFEKIEKNVVVHEHIHPVEKEEIQPIIYREREQLEVKQITQQMHETQIQPTLVQQRELAAEIRAPVVQRGAPIQENLVYATSDRDPTMRSTHVNAAIVNETIKKTVIEEIQPVMERDVIVPTIIKETLPIYEKVVEAPHVYRETLPVRELGNQPYVQREIVREVPVQQTVQPIQVTTTTTTTDSFIPAKLAHEELKTNPAPLGRKLH